MLRTAGRIGWRALCTLGLVLLLIVAGETVASAATPDPLHGSDAGLWRDLGGDFHHPIAVLGLALVTASVAVGLVLRWVRRAVQS